MKVQITVDDEMWKQAKARAALNGQTLGELVGDALGKIVKAVVNPVPISAEPVTGGGKVQPQPRGRTVGGIPATGAKPECKHVWIIRNGKTECQYCRSKP